MLKFLNELNEQKDYINKIKIKLMNFLNYMHNILYNILRCDDD